MIAKEKVKSKISQMKAERPNTRIDEAMFTAGVRFAESKSQTFEIDFCGHVKAKVEFKDGKLNTIAAMNGYGEAIDPDQITITPPEL